MSESIFVALCSLNDEELVPTVMNAFDSAKNPDNVFVGIAHSLLFKNPRLASAIKSELSDYMDKISYKVYSLTKNAGVGNGRISAYNEYSGQDYFLQLDSHSLFDEDWDTKIIDIYQDAKQSVNNDKIVLTAYIAKYLYNQSRQRVLKNPSGWLPTTATLHDGHYSEKFDYFDQESEEASSLNIWRHIPKWNDDYAISIWGEENYKFLPSYKLAGGMQFGGRKFAEDYPKLFPFPFYFFEEEFVTTIEILNLGYSIVFPNQDVPFAHLYSDDINQYGGSRESVNGDEIKQKNAEINFLQYLKNNKDKIKLWENYANFDMENKKFLGKMAIPQEYLTSKNINVE